VADILLDVQSPPATPSAGQAVIYVDNVSKKLSTKNDAGVIDTIDDILNNSVAAQGAGFATDTYLTGSSIPLLSVVPKVGTMYQCTFDVSKSAAGTAAPVLIVRYGTVGTVADTARLTFTFPAQTAIADVGMFTVWALFRTVGSATTAVLQGRAALTHKGTATGLTGLSVEPGPVVQVTSAGFDSTVASSIIGLSVNGGGSAAWTVQLVEAMVSNL
jgi:hypothetical protein